MEIGSITFGAEGFLSSSTVMHMTPSLKLLAAVRAEVSAVGGVISSFFMHEDIFITLSKMLVD